MQCHFFFANTGNEVRNFFKQRLFIPTEDIKAADGMLIKWMQFFFIVFAL